MSKIKLTKPSPYTSMVYKLIENNSFLIDIVHRQQTELEYMNLRVSSLVDYVKKKDKEKKSRMTPKKSYAAIRKDLH